METSNLERRRIFPKPWPLVCAIGLWVLLAGAPTTRGAADPLPEATQGEVTRYLIGLRQQGLFYLQAEYMKAYPPVAPAEQAWFQREQLLAQALQAPSIDGRLPLLARADDAAAKAIEAEPDSPRSILWRADRAQTWYYLASRPLFEQVLFYGAAPSVRRGLKESADRGAKAYEDAITAVAGYLDQLAGAQTEASMAQARRVNLNAFGLSKLLQFESCWVTLHRAYALEHGNVEQSLLAGQVVRSLQDQHMIQELTGGIPAQAEAFLMAAVASRLQTDWPTALQYLETTRKVVQTLPRLPSAQSYQWVGFASAIEQVRLQIDQGQFQKAIMDIDLQRKEMDAEGAFDPTTKFARKLSLAMLRFEACSLAADAASAQKNRSAQSSFSTQKFDALAALGADATESRQSIYQLVGDRLGDVAAVTNLPPFGKAVYAARWLRDSKFEQALTAADALDRDPAEKPDFLKQDAVFFKAVCLQELKQPVPAAQSYLRYARDFSQDKRAVAALLTGLSLLARQSDVLEDATSRAVLLDVGDLLLRSNAPQTEQNRQAWLPLVAEANLREGRYDRAAELFQMISPDSKQYGAAIVGRTLAISGKLRFATAAQDKQKVRAEAETVIKEAVQLSQKLTASKPADTQPEGVNVLAARLQLEAARLSIDVLGDADGALQLLEGAQDRWQRNPALLAQLLHVRVQALQKAGKLDQATQVVDQFMTVRPDAAGPLLASLLGDMQREIEQHIKSGRSEQATKYAALAAALAEHLDKWAAAHPDAIKPDQRYAIRYRLARALLQVGQSERALEVFEELYKQDAERNGGQAKDAAVLEGRADCMYGLQKWADARQAYLDIWRRATPRSEIWWQAILHSLQCSVQLQDDDPKKVLKVIRQHKELYPDMGGATLARQFEAISVEMMKRDSKAQASQPANKP